MKDFGCQSANSRRTPMNKVHTDILPGVPLIESPFFDEIFVAGHYDEEVLRIARDLNQNGFAVMQFPDPDFDQLAEAIRSSLRPRFDWPSWFESGQSQRIQDAWTFDDNVRRIAANDGVLDLLTILFGRRAFPFQTLTFPVGTQQHLHTDIVHFSSVPERFMCGVWVALEDVDVGAGPLVYVPGSHKWPVFANEHIGVDTRGTWVTQEIFEPLWRELLRKSGLVPKTFAPKKGQALIWLANLLHGGASHTDRAKTRWSQVTHYYFENCAYVTPMHSNPVCGDIFFRSLVDVKTGESVENQYLGRRIPLEFIDFTRSRSGISPADLEAQARMAASDNITSPGVIENVTSEPTPAASTLVAPDSGVPNEDSPLGPMLSGVAGAAVECQQGGSVDNVRDLMSLDGYAFVSSAYLSILRRPPDPDGLENYLAELRAGTEKLMIIWRLRNSVEAKRLRRDLRGYRAEFAKRFWNALLGRLSS